MAITIPNKELFRLDEVAALCNVHPDTVRNWIKKKHLLCIILPGGQHRIARSVIVSMLTPLRAD